LLYKEKRKITIQEVKNLTNQVNPWKKVAVFIIFIIWIALSYGVAVSIGLPIWQIVIALGVLWLFFVIIAYLVTKDWNQSPWQ
jgi:energy-coupling factor transporter transmembrane protein EcfT